MALAQVSNQLLRSQGSSGTTVASNYPITGDGSTNLPLGLAEDYRGADGESLTFSITDITDGHRVTISGIQGSSSFDVLDGQDGANGVNGLNGADGQSVTFDITNIASGHRVTLSGAQGSSSFDVMNGENGIDGVSPIFSFSEDASGVIVYISGAQGEDSFRLYNATSGEGATYSAGPNIDIYSDDDQLYISGKDWTDTIESAISSVSGDYVQNSALDYTPSMYISGISGHELYAESANHAFTAETANYVEGGWEYDEQNRISSYNGSAFVGQGGGSETYSAGDNINIYDDQGQLYISGKDWTDTIESTVSAFLSGSFELSAGDGIKLEDFPLDKKTVISVTGDYATHDELTGYQPAGNYYSASNPSGFITGVDLSNYYQKNETSSNDEISNALNDKQNAGDYYSASNPSGFITGVDLSEYAKSEDLTAYQEKGDYYSASNPSGFITGVDLSDYYKKNETSSRDEISNALTSKQDAGDYYSASNPSGFITGVDLSNYYQKNETSSNNEISNALSNKQDAGDYYSASNPSGFLTAHQDVTNLDYVQNSALGYTPSTFISSVSGHELYAESANHAFEAETANFVTGGWEYDSENHISSYNGSAFVGQNQATYDVKAGANIDVATADNTFTVSSKDWSTDINNAVSSKQDKGDYYSASNPSGFITGVDLSDYYTKNETSSKEEISAALTGSTASVTAWVKNQNYLTAHQSLAGLMSASKLEYNSNNKISGYDGSAFAGEERETIPVRGDNGISVSEVNNDVIIEISSVAHDNTISGNGTVSSPLGVVNGLPAGADITPYSAGANINITNHVVSGKNWSADITAASSYAYNQATADAQGHTYTGVAPIVVNNNEDKISANCIELSAGSGIDSTKLALGVIEVSSQGGGGSNFSSSAFGIVPSTQVTALTSLSYYDTGVGNSNQLSGNNTNNLGWTMPSAYANVKNDIITDTMPEVSSNYSYKLSYTTPATGFTANSGLEIRKYVGNTGTTRKVLSGNSTLGELVPEDYSNRQYLSTNAAGNMVWDNISNLMQIVLVATSGDIPASGSSDNKVYIVTGNS